MKAKQKKTSASIPEEEVLEEVIAEAPVMEEPAKNFSERVLEGESAHRSTPTKNRKKLMKRFRKAKKIPSEADVERFDPDLSEGLTEEQVELRFNQFLFNDVNKRYSKSYRAIFFGNICTFFNLLCVLVAAALVFAGAPISQFLFVGIFGINLSIGSGH
ncbi:MAG: hypothetical protein K2N74_03430 [Clostridiales bacterium]|nr:hypothetical protein [Clostridiales bacterium]